jgi:hypothetical protein
VTYSSGIGGPVDAVAEMTFEVDVKDIDNDGNIDVFIGDHAGILPYIDGSRLFRNVGNGMFEDRTVSAFSGVPFNNRGNLQDALFADLTGDGFTDLITTSNDGVGWAFRGDQSFHFTGFTQFPGEYGVPGWNGFIAGRGTSFGDIDNDGDLDVYLSSHGGQPKLLRNNITSWTDITSTLPTNMFSSIQPYFADFNGDGNVDLLTTVQLVYFGTPWPSGVQAQAHLLLGNGQGGFTDATQSSNIGPLALVNCPLGVGDLDNDGDLDIFQIGFQHDPVTRQFVSESIAYPKLLINNGQGVFADMTAVATGLPTSYPGSYPQFWDKGVIADLDNDGLQDLVLQRSGPKVYKNLGGFRFQAQTPSAFAFSYIGAMGAGDLDGNGGIDLVFTDRQGVDVKVLRNNLGGSGYLHVRLAGPSTARDAIGAKIHVYQAGHLGETAFLSGYRQVIASSNHHMPYAQHFGLPGGSARYDILVTWPDRSTSQRLGVASGQTIGISHSSR